MWSRSSVPRRTRCARYLGTLTTPTNVKAVTGSVKRRRLIAPSTKKLNRALVTHHNPAASAISLQPFRCSKCSCYSTQTVAQEQDDTILQEQEFAKTNPASVSHHPPTNSAVVEVLTGFGRSAVQTHHTRTAAKLSTPQTRDSHVELGTREKPDVQNKEVSPEVSEPTLSKIDESCFPLIVTALKNAKRLGLPTTVQKGQAIRTPGRTRHGRRSLSLVMQKASQLRTPPKVKAHRMQLPIMQQETQKNILGELAGNDVLIMVADTGSGKTTQVPQIILDDGITLGKKGFTNIVCTQPRRIAATSVARRVARERDQVLGQSVGFQIRFHSKAPKDLGSITYSTTQYLLRQLQYEEDETLSSLSHIIVDEVHERTVSMDLLITTLRSVAWSRQAQGKPFPKIILMSATIDSRLFKDFFAKTPPSPHSVVDPGEGNTYCMDPSGPKSSLRVSTLHVHGRMFPVETQYLDDLLPALQEENSGKTILGRSLRQNGIDDILPYLQREAKILSPTSSDTQSDLPADPIEEEDSYEVMPDSDPPVDVQEVVPDRLVAAAVFHVIKTSKDGDILVFLPGLGTIDAVSSVFDMLRQTKEAPADFYDKSKYRLFRLHSSLQDSNDIVFDPVPTGCRRIILATNIAETSLTLPDVVHVIDSGLVRQKTFDQLSGFTRFGTRWISKDDSLQRRGRAGRVRPGHYYTLFFRSRYEQLEQKTPPEMLRTDITKVCLDVKVSNPTSDVKQFFSQAPSPPDSATVNRAVKNLKTVGALTQENEVTRLGRILSALPLDPAITKMLLLGILFKCFRPLLIVACHAHDDPIVHSSSSRSQEWEARVRLADSTNSDLFAWTNAFEKYRAMAKPGSTANTTLLQANESIRPNVYKQMRLTAWQVCSMLVDIGLLPDACRDSPGRFLDRIPAELNENSDNLALVKALTYIGSNTNLSDYSFNAAKLVTGWKIPGPTLAIIDPRSVNAYPSKGKYKARRMARQAGELWTYRILHQTVGENRPFLVETTLLSPLAATLFAAKAKMESADVVRLNGWLRLKLEVDENTQGQDIVQPAKLVIEYRKAIQRFLALAFYTLEDEKRLDRQDDRQKWNVMFKEDSELKTNFVTSLANILSTDQSAWNVLREAAYTAAEDEIEYLKAVKEEEQKAKRAQTEGRPKNIDDEVEAQDISTSGENDDVSKEQRSMPELQDTHTLEDGDPQTNGGEKNPVVIINVESLTVRKYEGASSPVLEPSRPKIVDEFVL